MKSWIAIASESNVCSPGIGVWIPKCQEGDLVVGGQRIGQIVRAGKSIDVLAPEGEPVRAGGVCPSHTSVEYGSVLFSKGGGSREGEATERPGLSLPAGFVEICAPMAGTLYKQSSPGAPPFAPEGAFVDSQTTVGLVEVMKSLNPVRTAVQGCVERWLVADGEPVSSGQPLLWMRPKDTRD